MSDYYDDSHPKYYETPSSKLVEISNTSDICFDSLKIDLLPITQNMYTFPTSVCQSNSLQLSASHTFH